MRVENSLFFFLKRGMVADFSTMCFAFVFGDEVILCRQKCSSRWSMESVAFP